MNAAPAPCDLLLRAGVLVTQDPARRVIEDAGLAVAGGLLVAVGPWAEVRAGWTPARILDLSRRLVLPGLVNTHCHAAMTAFRGLADDMALMPWLTGHIWPAEARMTPGLVHDGTLLACAEMLATGTTCFADMYFFETEAARAVERMGMRAVLGEGLLDFPTPAYATPGQGLARARELIDALRGRPLLGAALAPHSAYATGPDTLARSRELAASLGLPWMIHAAESADETAQCMEKHGLRPLELLARLGCLGPGTVLVHMTDVTAQEIALVAASGVGVSHNPRSNMKLASGQAPAAQMLAAGVPLGLGTDGAGSGNTLNLFATMAATALTQKALTGDPTALPAQAALDAATLGGARLLGRADLGALAPGHPADLAALDLDHPGLVPLYNPVSHAVYAATGAEVRLTMVAGRVVYEDGVLAGATRAELGACAARLRAWATGH